ncbi:hypothetical protein GLOIN_2v1787906 [Rhizophagus irregularis DAOM 181602=DAOM 197198]|nr:hypothetical protein GLOIN_2v1787906 [Rhizophagus irregularis DAOM 181602=DAOM 197198]
MAELIQKLWEMLTLNGPQRPPPKHSSSGCTRTFKTIDDMNKHHNAMNYIMITLNGVKSNGEKAFSKKQAEELYFIMESKGLVSESSEKLTQLSREKIKELKNWEKWQLLPSRTLSCPLVNNLHAQVQQLLPHQYRNVPFYLRAFHPTVVGYRVMHRGNLISQYFSDSPPASAPEEPRHVLIEEDIHSRVSFHFRQRFIFTCITGSDTATNPSELDFLRQRISELENFDLKREVAKLRECNEEHGSRIEELEKSREDFKSRLARALRADWEIWGLYLPMRCEYISAILHALLYIVKRITDKELTLAPQLEVVGEENTS